MRLRYSRAALGGGVRACGRSVHAPRGSTQDVSQKICLPTTNQPFNPVSYVGLSRRAATPNILAREQTYRKLDNVSFAGRDDFEVALKLAKYNYKVGEISIKFFPRTYKDGKKVNFFDAIKGFLVILYFYFN